MSWTDERVAQLKHLWGEGKTAAEIAKLLGGVTRNAVIGKAHRLKLSGRVSPIQHNPRVEATLNRASNDQIKQPRVQIRERAPISAVIPPSLREENIPIKGIQLTELRESTCRWPIGDPKQEGFKFCGCHSETGSYCDNHARLAYQVSTRGRLKVDELAKIDTNVVRKIAG